MHFRGKLLIWAETLLWTPSSRAMRTFLLYVRLFASVPSAYVVVRMVVIGVCFIVSSFFLCGKFWSVFPGTERTVPKGLISGFTLCLHVHQGHLDMAIIHWQFRVITHDCVGVGVAMLKYIWNKYLCVIGVSISTIFLTWLTISTPQPSNGAQESPFEHIIVGGKDNAFIQMCTGNEVLNSPVVREGLWRMQVELI